jgi:hypothetical protein
MGRIEQQRATAFRRLDGFERRIEFVLNVHHDALARLFETQKDRKTKKTGEFCAVSPTRASVYCP